MKQKGITIIQLMVILLVAGIAGSYIVDAVIDKRCSTDPSASLCKDRKADR